MDWKNKTWVNDDAFAEAYEEATRVVGNRRENFTSKTENMELMKMILGPMYGHVSIDWLRQRVATLGKAGRLGSGD